MRALIETKRVTVAGNSLRRRFSRSAHLDATLSKIPLYKVVDVCRNFIVAISASACYLYYLY